MDGAGCNCLEVGLGDALALLACRALPQHGWVRGEAPRVCRESGAAVPELARRVAGREFISQLSRQLKAIASDVPMIC